MAEDIVTRLRTCSAADPDEYTWWQTFSQAAIEIESLRAKLALTEEELFRMARMMAEMSESYRQLRHDYEKVRGNA